MGSYGFEIKQNRTKLRDLLKEKTGNVLIVPSNDPFSIKAAKSEIMHIVDTGFDKEKIFLCDYTNISNLLKLKFDVILIPGGNTFKLLYDIRENHLDTFIKQQVYAGAVYFGFSAGAYLSCPDIEYVKVFDDNNHITDGNFRALGLTDKYIVAHFDNRGYQEIMMCKNFIGYDAELITINDNELAVI